MPKRRSKTTTWGVAKTGQISDQGTVTEREHWDGRRDVIVRPNRISVGTRATLEERSRPTNVPPEKTVTYRLALLDGERYVHLRDIEAGLRAAGYGQLADRIVTAAGASPARDSIVIPTPIRVTGETQH